ncbi:MAG: hypothetical protein RDV48_15865 [Candidatus Eremiobacteraeota bacterium]|nr:hypothetical protein [Candidatus Eremiobacteraeota bacterium]
MDRISHHGITPHIAGDWSSILAGARQLKGESSPPPSSVRDLAELSGAQEVKPEDRLREKHHALHDSMEAAHIAGEVFKAAGTGGILAAAAGAGSIASGIYFAIEGARDLREAREKKDLLAGIESAGHLMLSGEVAVDAARLAMQSGALQGIAGSAIAAAISSPLATAAGTALGVGHGAAEIITGGKEFLEGFRNKDVKKALAGGLTIGIGSSAAAVSLGGGLPACIALGTFFTVETVISHLLEK